MFYIVFEVFLMVGKKLHDYGMQCSRRDNGDDFNNEIPLDYDFIVLQH